MMFLNIKLGMRQSKGCILGLIGPPGVGKTAIARALASSLDFPFQHVSCGAITSLDYLMGHDYTFLGAQPGHVVRMLAHMKYKNGILLFDEFEKLAKAETILGALLHIMDFTQNHEFHDNYLSELSIDLSHCWFILSMNELPDDSAMRDRIYPIYVDGYGETDKVHIACNYVLPRVLDDSGLGKRDVVLSREVAQALIRMVDSPDIKGVRRLAQVLREIVYKVKFAIEHPDIPTTFNVRGTFPFTLTVEHIRKLVSVDELDKSYAVSMYN